MPATDGQALKSAHSPVGLDTIVVTVLVVLPVNVVYVTIVDDVEVIVAVIEDDEVDVTLVEDVVVLVVLVVVVVRAKTNVCCRRTLGAPTANRLMPIQKSFSPSGAPLMESSRTTVSCPAIRTIFL